jgi:hypothetical protein
MARFDPRHPRWPDYALSTATSTTTSAMYALTASSVIATAFCFAPGRFNHPSTGAMALSDTGALPDENWARGALATRPARAGAIAGLALALDVRQPTQSLPNFG